MCRPSVFNNHTSSETSSINTTEKEKVMRKSIVTVLTLTVALTLATPAVAAPRERDRSQPPSLTLILKKLVKRVFGISSTGDIVAPIPAPAGKS